ncbi:MAG: diguanylate cyclase [Gammaproteobacteria bacterium]|nr:diguanylate cyclase [Gammaproteobacteria bacterium]
MEKQKILVVDDERFNINVVVDLLKSEHQILAAKSGEQALKVATSDNKPDLILLDIMMPEMDGYEVCEKLKSDEKTKDIPIIFLTSKTDEDSIGKAFEAGGVDYVTKPIKTKELIARVRTHLKMQTLINHLEHISSYDQLTNIFNRRKFFEIAEKMFQSSEPVFAAMADIDKFKSVNDTYGHPIGDVVLKSVVSNIKENLPGDTCLGRLGGEEFAIIYQGLTQDKVLENLESIRETIEQTDVAIDKSRTLNVTISIGVVEKLMTHHSFDELLKASDDALYEAKGTGRNKSIFRNS